MRMKRLNISFYDEIYEKLVARAETSKEKSIAQGVRELVDLGLKLEEAAKQTDAKETENDSEKIIEMLKNILIWTMETRLLTRYIVESSPGENKQKLIEKLNEYKETSASYIKGMLGEAIV
jgi:hypothetical protein